MKRPELKALAGPLVRDVVEDSIGLLDVVETYEHLTEEEANDLLDVIKEARIALTWEDDE